MGRRELLIGAALAALLIAGVFLLGPPDRGSPAPPSPSADGAVLERPVGLPPEDPRRLSAPAHRNPPAAPTSSNESDRTPEYAVVRVVDARGAPRPGTPVELRDADPELDPSARLLAPIVVADRRGEARIPISKAAARGAFFVPGLALREAHAVRFDPQAPDAVRIATPDVGSAEVSFVDVDGAPYLKPVEVSILIAQCDPSPDALVRARRSTRTVDGVATLVGIETGTFLLIEARTVDAERSVRPSLVEGPTEEGATLFAVMTVVPRAAVPEGVRFAPPALGPPRATPPNPEPQEGVLVVRSPDAPRLPWPFALEAVSAEGRRDDTARVDEKGAARMASPAGRRSAGLRLWRAAPDGWRSIDLDFAPVSAAVPARGIVEVSAPIPPDVLDAAVAALTLR